jgi:hypothetical protein
MTAHCPSHDFSDPIQYLNGLEMASHAARNAHCPFCASGFELVPMPGDGWGYSTLHEPDCPDLDE